MRATWRVGELVHQLLTGHADIRDGPQHVDKMHFGFRDIDRGHKDVVGNGREQAVGDVVGRQLGLPLEAEHVVDHRREQMLVVDDGDDGEKDHQQGGERQRLLKGLADLVLLDDAVEGGEQHDHRQADDADRRQVEGQGQNQPDAGQGLDDQFASCP